MEEVNKKEIKEIIEWCDEKGHSEHEILELIRRIVNAKPRDKMEAKITRNETVQEKEQNENVCI